MLRKQRHTPQLQEQLTTAFWNPEDTKPTEMPSSREGRLAYARGRLAFQILSVVETEMQKRGLEQRDLAKLMQVSDGRVSQILSGSQNLSLQTLAALAVALDVDFDVQLVHPESTRVPRGHGQYA